MIRNIFSTAVFLAVICSFTASQAQDGMHNWTGFYVGVHGGVVDGEANSKGLTTGNFGQGNAAPGVEFSIDTTGAFGGGQIGYNYQMNNFVAGLEVDFGGLGADGTQLGFPNAPAGQDDTGMNTSYGAYGVVAGRLGLAVENSLFYVKGGLALAQVDFKAGDLDTGVFDPNDVTSFDDWLTGYAVGGGFEYAFASNWSLKAEYLYLGFEKNSLETPPGVGVTDGRYENSFDLHTFKVGLNYNF